jgi:hypothetical protein
MRRKKNKDVINVIMKINRYGEKKFIRNDTEEEVQIAFIRKINVLNQNEYLEFKIDLREFSDLLEIVNLKILKKTDLRTGREYLIDIDSNKEIKGYIKELNENGEGYFVKKKKKDNLNEEKIIYLNLIEISEKKERRKESQFFDRNNNREIVDIEKQKDSKTKQFYLINKNNKKIISNITTKDQNGNEIWIKLDLVNSNDYLINTKKDLEFVIRRNSNNEKGILINRETGEEIPYFELKRSENTNEDYFINTETKERIDDIEIKMDNKTGEMFYTIPVNIINQLQQDENQIKLIEMKIKKNNKNKTYYLINEETGKEINDYLIKEEKKNR